jgi:hypothetical protein
MNEPQPTPPTPAQRVRGWMHRHPWLSGFLLLLSVWMAFDWIVDTPIRNPWPDEPLVIRGKFPFDRGYELVFMVNAIGEAKWYRRRCGGIQREEAVCSGGRAFVKPRKIDGQHYEMVLYRDFYLRGPQQWKTTYWDVVYDPSYGVAPEDLLITSSGWGPHIICKDSEASKATFRGRLSCTGQFDSESKTSGWVKYMHMNLPSTPARSPEEEVVDYWLSSELDRMLLEQRKAEP